MRDSHTANNIQVTERVVFNTDKFTSLLHLKESPLVPEGIQSHADRLGLLMKPESHITIIGFATGRKLKEAVGVLKVEDDALIIDFFHSLLNRYDWKYESTPEYYVVTKDYQFKNKPSETRTSLIQVIVLPDLARCYDVLNDTFSVQFEPSYAHVTLYTSSTNPENQHAGIGINSKEDFLKIKPVLLQA